MPDSDLTGRREQAARWFVEVTNTGALAFANAPTDNDVTQLVHALR